MSLFGDLIERFTEGEIKALAKKALDPYVAKGDIDAGQEIVMEQALIDFAQLLLAEYERRPAPTA